MARLIPSPHRIEAAGTPPKLIDEYVGRVNTGTEALSIAHMRSPEGWEEPGQRPEFDEYTVVLRGVLEVRPEAGDVLAVGEGQGVHVPAGEWVQYASPHPGGAEYVAVCVPAFSPEAAHRDDEAVDGPVG